MSEEVDGVRLPIERVIPRELSSRYANHFVAQHADDLFFISFFEVVPPILIGNTEEIGKQAAEIGSIKAECVSRIILSPERMSELIDILQRNLEKYQQTLELSEE